VHFHLFGSRLNAVAGLEDAVINIRAGSVLSYRVTVIASRAALGIEK
jgi:hypothetical protein